MDNSPKICLLYYKNILDACMSSFFEDYSGRFSKNSAGGYSFSAASGAVKKYFKAAVKAELLNYVREFNVLKPEYTFIIGGCSPSKNILLDYKKGYFPEKLSMLLADSSCPRYVLREKDILVNMREFGEIFDDIFIDMFKNGMRKFLGKNYGNVFAIRHSRLDCYAMFKVLKYVYGKPNCVNVWKNAGSRPCRCILSINDVINKYVNNKTDMNKSPEFKQIVGEIRQYSENKIKEFRNG